mmetsp:Transcript_17996/g.30211  ORF Transcript_17996/g.30211 Transcript_17996/m.30211 type:complete len:474 (-) Transcript_17996:1514-2935(-)
MSSTIEKETQNTLRIIHVLEKRLSATEHNLGQDDILKGLLPTKGVTLYFFLLGDAYLKLYHLKGSPKVTSYGLNAAERCLQAFESAVSSASNCLDIVHPLRLLCIYSWCTAMVALKNKHKTARMIATKTVNSASLHTNTIDEKSIDLLQRLREDIMSYVAKPKLPDKTERSQGTPNVVSLDKEGYDAYDRDDDDDDDDNSGKNVSESSTIERILEPHGEAQQTVLKKFVVDTANDVYSKIEHGVSVGVPAVRREIIAVVNTVRRVVSLPVPVQLDVVSSASHILKALDRIFRTYVRGTALPGQLAGGNTVEFDGTVMTFRHFILHGPYISWRGFVQFLMDFGIASPPPIASRMGRTFLSEVLKQYNTRSSMVQNQMPVEMEGSTGPVTMMEAAVAFIEAAKSITPALVLSKFMKIYEEMAQDAEEEPWTVVMGWASNPSRREWDIKSGVNFMQFCDCLGVRSFPDSELTPFFA